jgi:hypothetical protein
VHRRIREFAQNSSGRIISWDDTIGSSDHSSGHALRVWSLSILVHNYSSAASEGLKQFAYGLAIHVQNNATRCHPWSQSIPAHNGFIGTACLRKPEAAVYGC